MELVHWHSLEYEYPLRSISLDPFLILEQVKYFTLVYTKTVNSVDGEALIGSSNSEYPVLFTSEQLERKWRPGLDP